jgi:hypothetical protein
MRILKELGPIQANSCVRELRWDRLYGKKYAVLLKLKNSRKYRNVNARIFRQSQFAMNRVWRKKNGPEHLRCSGPLPFAEAGKALELVSVGEPLQQRRPG